MSNDALAGKHALVIGGSTGIGLASAQALLRDGASVWIAGRNAEKLEAARKRLAEGGTGRVEAVRCDGMDSEQVQAAVHAASHSTGLDIALAIPGGGGYSQILDYADDDFDAQILQNLRPTHLALKYCGRAMVRAGGGSFVAVSSTAAVMVSPYLGAYCAAKAAIDQLVRVAAEELGAQRVRVNAVRPGLTRTATTGDMVETPAIMDRFLAEQPIDRTGEAADIAGTVRFLAGPESSWLTGQCITVDGGHTLRKFPDMTDIARSIAGDERFDAVRRGDVDD